jgi:hypothetical protein
MIIILYETYKCQNIFGTIYKKIVDQNENSTIQISCDIYNLDIIKIYFSWKV